MKKRGKESEQVIVKWHHTRHKISLSTVLALSLCRHSLTYSCEIPSEAQFIVHFPLLLSVWVCVCVCVRVCVFSQSAKSEFNCTICTQQLQQSTWMCLCLSFCFSWHFSSSSTLYLPIVHLLASTCVSHFFFLLLIRNLFAKEGGRVSHTESWPREKGSNKCILWTSFLESTREACDSWAVRVRQSVSPRLLHLIALCFSRSLPAEQLITQRTKKSTNHRAPCPAPVIITLVTCVCVY